MTQATDEVIVHGGTFWHCRDKMIRVSASKWMKPAEARKHLDELGIADDADKVLAFARRFAKDGPKALVYQDNYPTIEYRNARFQVVTSTEETKTCGRKHRTLPKILRHLRRAHS